MSAGPPAGRGLAEPSARRTLRPGRGGGAGPGPPGRASAVPDGVGSSNGWGRCRDADQLIEHLGCVLGQFNGSVGRRSADDAGRAMMAPVPYAYLAVSVLGVLCVATAYRPIRREPVSVLSFIIGWPVAELAIVNMACAVALTAVFGALGAFGTWPGYLGLALTVLGVVGLAGLALSARHDTRVVAKAVSSSLPDPSPSALRLPPPEWGRWWRGDQGHALVEPSGRGRQTDRLLGRRQPSPPARHSATHAAASTVRR